MLNITIAGEEYWDEVQEVFVTPDAIELVLEHSLVSLSKWEMEFKEAFLGPKDKTAEQALGYIHAMVVSPEIPREALNWLSEKNIEEINTYIGDSKTATWFNEVGPAPRNTEVITSELIYFWLSGFGIPFSPVENWHLSRLFTVLRVANAKNSKPKPMSREEVYARNKEINKRNREKYGTSG